MMTREEIIDKVADLYIEGSDSDGGWSLDILDAVMSLLVTEGSDRLSQCGDCSTWYPTRHYDCCPHWDSHDCEECGNRNEECSCDDCPDCGCYIDDCECLHCTRCGERQSGCECEVETAVFQ